MSDDPLIPLPRIVGEGDSGLDVFAYRRALKSLGFVPHAKRGRFEANMVEGVTRLPEAGPHNADRLDRQAHVRAPLPPRRRLRPLAAGVIRAQAEAARQDGGRAAVGHRQLRPDPLSGRRRPRAERDGDRAREVAKPRASDYARLLRVRRVHRGGGGRPGSDRHEVRRPWACQYRHHAQPLPRDRAGRAQARRLRRPRPRSGQARLRRPERGRSHRTPSSPATARRRARCRSR